MAEQNVTIIDGQANRQKQPSQRLYRSSTDRHLAGVCGGMADYFGVEAGLVRLGWIIAGLFTLGGALLPGAWADLVVVDGDPLKDVRVLGDHERMRLVMLEGRAVAGREIGVSAQLSTGHFWA